MIWLILNIICLVWIIIWIIFHFKLITEVAIYRCSFKGLSLWTLILPIIIYAVTFALVIKSIW